METVVSMLQEDAVTPATVYPPPQKEKKNNNKGPAGTCSSIPGGPGGCGMGREQMEQKCVRRSWRNHGRSPGPHTVLPSARAPRGAGPDHTVGGAGSSPLPPLPTASPQRPWGSCGAAPEGPPRPREGRAAWPEAQLEGSKKALSWGAVSLWCPSQGRKGGVSKWE